LPRALWVAGFALAAAAIAVQAWYFEWKLDDAYISFAYARNWVEGRGLVFNVGERVEGYTCFLWVALMALGLWLGVEVEPWSSVLGVGAALGTVVATAGFAAEISPPRRRAWAVVPGVLLALWPPLSWWAVSGMETALFTFLVTMAAWWHVRTGAGSVAAPAFSALAAMTRPEAWLLSGLFCLDALRLRGWSGVRYGAVFALLFGPYFGWRAYYYGSLLPNTFYAKVGWTTAQVWRGVRYLELFWRDWGAVLLAGAALSVVLLARERSARAGGDGAAEHRERAVFARLLALYAFLAGYAAYVVAVGGDAFHFHRFWLPIAPALLVLAWAAFVRGLGQSARARIATTAAACFALWWLGASLPRALSAEMRDLGPARFLRAAGRATGECIRRRTAPTESIAAIGIGALRYFSDRPVIDMLGLTDLHIARETEVPMGAGLAGHEKYDSGYVLSRRPTYICVPEENRPGLVPAHSDIWRHAEFRARYRQDQCGCYRIASGSPAGRGVPHVAQSERPPSSGRGLVARSPKAEIYRLVAEIRRMECRDVDPLAAREAARTTLRRQWKAYLRRLSPEERSTPERALLEVRVQKALRLRRGEARFSDWCRSLALP